MELFQVFVLANKFMFCTCAQSCKQTMAWLEMTRCLKAFYSSSLFFVCLFVRRHFSFFFVCFFFTDVPEESMQNVNRIDCQQLGVVEISKSLF